MPDLSLPQLDRQVNELSSICELQQQLARNIQRILLKAMDKFYQPMLVFKPFNQSQGMQVGLRNYADLELREIKPTFKKLTCKPFGMLFCRTDRSALDLALYCKLSYEKMVHLREQLPQYVTSYKDNQKVLKNEYGDQAAEIIKVFTELIKQDIYSCGMCWDEKLFEILKSNTKTTQSFFPVMCMDEKQENIDNAYHFFKKYFYNISFYKRIMARASSILPLLGNKSAFSSYYRNLIDDFMDNAEDTIYDEKSLNATLGFSTKVLRDVNTLQVPSYLKRSIRECKTTQRAIDIMKSHKATNNSNIARLRTDERELLKDPHSLNYLSQGTSEVLSVYQYLLKVPCDIIGHYCAIILLRCNTIRLENMNSTSEEKSKAISI